MRRNYTIRSFVDDNDAQPWDAYVTGTTSSADGDQGKDTKSRRPKQS
jgi:hypothetical protein